VLPGDVIPVREKERLIRASEAENLEPLNLSMEVSHEVDI